MLPVRQFTEREDRADVRVTQRGCGTRFLLQARDTGRVLGQVLRKNFESDSPVELVVLGEPHVAHSAAAKPSDQLIRIHPRSGAECHETARV